MIRIKDVKVFEDLTKKELLNFVLKKNKINIEDVKDWYIFKKSIDARDKENVHYVYTVDIELKNYSKYKKFLKIEKYQFPKINIKRINLEDAQKLIKKGKMSEEESSEESLEKGRKDGELITSGRYRFPSIFRRGREGGMYSWRIPCRQRSFRCVGRHLSRPFGFCGLYLLGYEGRPRGRKDHQPR